MSPHLKYYVEKHASVVNLRKKLPSIKVRWRKKLSDLLFKFSNFRDLFLFLWVVYHLIQHVKLQSRNQLTTTTEKVLHWRLAASKGHTRNGTLVSYLHLMMQTDPVSGILHVFNK